jgi:phage terminase large subunit-like protein
MVRRKKRERKSLAQDAIDWCEDFLKIPDGRNVGQPMKLPKFIQDDFKAIFDNPAGTRRAIISRGRKNGKTLEAAMLVLLHLCSDLARRNSDLFSAAQSRDQAALLFNLAAKMVRLSPELNAVVVVRETAKELQCPRKGTKYRALSAEATTAFGLNPALIIFDELGQVRGPRSALFEALETATAAQENPLSIIISTQAPTDADLLSILIDDAKAGHDDRTVLQLQSAAPDLDPFSEAAIREANPAFDAFMNRDEVIAMAESARRMPARQAEYENLVLNRRVEANNPFVSPQAWKACGAAVGDLHGVPVYAGLDLSSVSDLTALVLIGRIGRVWHVEPTFWLPAESLYDRAQKDHVPYDLWHRQGYLQTTPGNSVSYEYVAQHLFKVFKEYDVQKLAFDRWGMQYLVPWLQRAGFSDNVIEEKFVEFGQGTQSQSPPLRDLEQAILEREIAHGDHPLMAMCATCAVVESKDASNRKLSKQKSNGRIDGLVALVDAFGVAPMMAKTVDIEAMIA